MCALYTSPGIISFMGRRGFLALALLCVWCVVCGVWCVLCCVCVCWGGGGVPGNRSAKMGQAIHDGLAFNILDTLYVRNQSRKMDLHDPVVQKMYAGS